MSHSWLSFACFCFKIIAALLYKIQGPILQHVNENTQVWDTAFMGTDIRDNKCHPNRLIEEVPCCACTNQTQIAPVIPIEEFIYCRPVVGGYENGATDCSTEEHNLEPRQVRQVLPSSCPIPASNP
jgi:hypothetical protein